MHAPAIRASALILAVLLAAPWPLPATCGTQASSFGGGLQELLICFPPGGGANGSVNISLPAQASVLSAVMDITGLPSVFRGSLDYSTPEKLMQAPSGLNLTLGTDGARLAAFNWSRVQATDSELGTDEGANISVGNGVHISDAITGGVSHSFSVVSGIDLTGMPSVDCTPDGEILIAWIQHNQSYPFADVSFQRFDSSGTGIGPKIMHGTTTGLHLSKPRAISDDAGRAIFIFDAWAMVNGSVFDSSGNQVVSGFEIGDGDYGSAVVTGPDEMFGSWVRSSSGNQQCGRWYHLNGTPIGNEIILEIENSNPEPSGIVSVGPDKSIAFASTDLNSTDSHSRAYVLRKSSSGAILHDRVFVGANDSYTTPTSFAILDDGTTAVAYTADYPGRSFEVRCARVAANGTIIGQFTLHNETGTGFFNPSLCRLPGNRFACAWGQRVGGLDFYIEGRVFRADGAPEGAVFSMGNAYGVNASWELCARGNSSLALVVRSDDPAPYGAIRVEVVELQRALTGQLFSPVLDRPGTVIADVRLAADATYSVDVLDAETRNVTASGLRNGDAVMNWSPYILRLNLERTSFNASVSEPAVLSFGVATRVCDFFEDKYLISFTRSVEVSNGRAVLMAGASEGELESRNIVLPYRAVSLDNLSWNGDMGILPYLRSLSGGVWGSWEPSHSNPDMELVPPPGDAIRWKFDYVSSNPVRPVMESITLAYSLLHKTGFLQSAPVNLTDGNFGSYRVNRTFSGQGTVHALVTTDGGMTYDEASNGTWESAGGQGRALQAMLVLEGNGDRSPLLSGFSLDYEAQSSPSGIELEIDQNYRWSPPEGSDLENGVQVRDFAAPLNAVLGRSAGTGNVTIPLNFTSKTAGILKVNGLRLALNFPPVIASFSPEADPTMEAGSVQHFELSASDPDGDALMINWSVDGQIAATGPSFDYTAPGPEGDHTVLASVSDGRIYTIRSWNVSVVFVDRNLPPVIQARFPTDDMVINETDVLNFSITASDPENQPLRCSWYVDGEKVSSSDNLTWRTWYNSSGMHAVWVTVSDGAKNVSTSWNVAVLDRDRAPVISGWRPEKPLAARPGTTLQFGINVSDPDGDAIGVSWYVDGNRAVNATSPNFSLVAPWSDGLVHSVKAVASGSNLSAMREWRIRSIIPDEETGLDVSDPWCLLMLGIVIPAIAAAVVLGRLGKRGAAQ